MTKVEKNEWVFGINTKTGKLRMTVPKQREYSANDMVNVAVGLVRCCGSIASVLNQMLSEGNKKRTTHRSRKGPKLYPLRSEKSRLKDIVEYNRAHQGHKGRKG